MVIYKQQSIVKSVFLQLRPLQPVTDVNCVVALRYKILPKHLHAIWSSVRCLF